MKTRRRPSPNSKPADEPTAANVADLATVSEESFAGAEERKISLPYYPGKYMTGTEYALEHAVPNFLFHVTIGYAIARKQGVPLAKSDYINGLPLKDLG